MPASRYAPIQPIVDDDISNDPQDSSNSSHGSVEAARLTPETDSQEEEDDELEMSEVGQSFKMKRLIPEPLYNQEAINDTGRIESERDIGLRTLRRDSVQSFELYTPDEEKEVVQKLDRRLVLFMALLYMLSFLDRSNIGNARIAGLAQDLRLTGSQYEWLLTAFYITYILFEWMTLMYRLVPPHMYIAFCVLFWGILASLQSVATSFTGLIIIRALLGIGEAAFGPGVPFYLSFFYRRNELAFRTGLFMSAAPLASSFASSLAWMIIKIGQHAPIASWRLLFLIEGFPSVVAAVFAWSNVPDNPKTARFLTSRQRRIAKLRLRREASIGDAAQSDDPTEIPAKERLDLREVLQTLADPKCYFTALMFFSCNVAFSSMPVFLPTIINEMGYSSLASQALAAPPHIFAFVIVLVTAYLSDRTKNRGLFIALHALLAASGYALIAATGFARWSALWRYCGIYPAVAGFFAAVTLIITWTINNQESDSKKGTGMAMLNIIGQCGPLVGTRLYPDTDKPYFVKGMSICAAFMLFVFAGALGLRAVLKKANTRKSQALAQEIDATGNTPLVSEFGFKTRKNQFMYIL